MARKAEPYLQKVKESLLCTQAKACGYYLEDRVPLWGGRAGLRFGFVPAWAGSLPSHPENAMIGSAPRSGFWDSDGSVLASPLAVFFEVTNGASPFSAAPSWWVKQAKLTIRTVKQWWVRKVDF